VTYSVIVALTGLPIGYSVIVALIGLPIGQTGLTINSTIKLLHNVKTKWPINMKFDWTLKTG